MKNKYIKPEIEKISIFRDIITLSDQTSGNSSGGYYDESGNWIPADESDTK